MAQQTGQFVMSMNITILAKREIIVLATGEREVQAEYFNVWQTPTKDTYEIVNSANPLQAYKDWVTEVGKELGETEEPIYADDDIFCERDPIGVKRYNPADDHLLDLDKWVESVTKRGYDIFVEVA